MTLMTYILLSKCLRSSDSSIAISCIISSASFMPVYEREQPWDNLNQRCNSKQVNKSSELVCTVTHFYKIFYSNFVFCRKYPSTHPFSVSLILLILTERSIYEHERLIPLYISNFSCARAKYLHHHVLSFLSKAS